MKKIFIFTLSLLLLLPKEALSQQTNYKVSSLLEEQREIFPQEKLYVHTDKSHYISGDNIWFRAYLLDASTHTPAYLSQYIYVELINPMDSVVSRVKIKQHDDAYFGHMPIDETMAEGDYQLRSYTLFMENQEEEYMFRKKIKILHPFSANIHTDIKPDISEKSRQTIQIKLTDISKQKAIHPRFVEITTRPEYVKASHKTIDSTQLISYNPSQLPRQPTISVKYGDFHKLITVPGLQEDYDVSFLPEGGNLLAGTENRIAFKALKKDGQFVDICGFIRDQEDNKIIDFSSLQFGMGYFTLIPQAGKKYYAVCKNKNGYHKEFELPAAIPDMYGLSTTWTENRLHIMVKRSGDLQQTTSPLLVVGHTRGIVQFEQEWEWSKNRLIINRQSIPSGILHILLMDMERNILSERLVFCNKENESMIAISTHKTNYAPREEIKIDLQLCPKLNQKAYLSASVVDANDVSIDSTYSLQSYLLLASELKGHIYQPHFYFDQNIEKQQREQSLDVLMMTQGWRRYDIPTLVKGQYTFPTKPLEIGQEISGTVKGLIVQNRVKESSVSIASIDGSYGNVTTTDENGRFYFHGFDFPDSTTYMVQALSPKGKTNIELYVDEETFPANHIQIPVQYTGPAINNDSKHLIDFIKKADNKWKIENGMRTIHLGDVVITQTKYQPERNRLYNFEPHYIFNKDVIERRSIHDLHSLLYGLPGISISSGTRKRIYMRNGYTHARIMIDNILMDEDFVLNDIEPFDVESMQILKPARTSIFGSIGMGGFILIYTKKGEDMSNFKYTQYHNKLVTPLGYQIPAEFYSPKYDTPAEPGTPDFRTTIHWVPNIQTDEKGSASFSFYAADTQPNYWVIIEGISEDGEIISIREKID